VEDAWLAPLGDVLSAKLDIISIITIVFQIALQDLSLYLKLCNAQTAHQPVHHA